jgi:hypothetical protein
MLAPEFKVNGQPLTVRSYQPLHWHYNTHADRWSIEAETSADVIHVNGRAFNVVERTDKHLILAEPGTVFTSTPATPGSLGG